MAFDQRPRPTLEPSPATHQGHDPSSELSEVVSAPGDAALLGTAGGDASALLPWMDDLLSFGISDQPVHDEHATPTTHVPGPRRVADSGPGIPKGAKFDPNWTAVAHGQIREDWAPNNIIVPDAVDRGLTEAWNHTVKDPQHREHGGNIVRKYDGEYGMRHGDVGTTHMYEPDYNDHKLTEDYVGGFHTHPYMDEGYDHGTFSGGDFANLANHDGTMNLMRSGSNATYMMVKTKEFQSMIDANENAGPMSDIEDRRAAFSKGIEDTFDDAEAAWEKAHPGDFTGGLEAGAAATSRKYHIPYYEGTGKNLHRVGATPKK